MDRSIGHRARPTSPRRSGRHAHACGSQRGQHHAKQRFATAALTMVFKLVESTQARWRAVNAPHLVALVRAGARAA
ncbi:hypothetical protein C5L38_07390 [Streptomyces sp. WAC00288]|uniref:Transposase n=1 Tax=Streptomyces cinereoruber TaxID=67260 RepID=A0ABX6BNI8_9ACTN|nr:hypothetical protein C5L38_07390 [Streptomyces sp. WAC00288]PVC77094.1 hypothetical protein DBP18_01420 [Streptomyces sp. CS081A]QEV35326.1 hypothetical protein CP977_26755 [Streptomyces cinereoruber]